MKTVLSSILALSFALGASTSVFAADPAVEEAWRDNTRAQNTPFEWAVAKRLAQASSQVASSGAIQSDAQSDASNQNSTRTLSLTPRIRLKSTWIDTFEDKPWFIH